MQGLLNVLAAPNTTDEGKMFMEGLQVSTNLNNLKNNKQQNNLKKNKTKQKTI